MLTSILYKATFPASSLAMFSSVFALQPSPKTCLNVEYAISTAHRLPYSTSLVRTRDWI